MSKRKLSPYFKGRGKQESQGFQQKNRDRDDGWSGDRNHGGGGHGSERIDWNLGYGRDDGGDRNAEHEGQQQGSVRDDLSSGGGWRQSKGSSGTGAWNRYWDNKDPSSRDRDVRRKKKGRNEFKNLKKTEIDHSSNITQSVTRSSMKKKVRNVEQNVTDSEDDFITPKSKRKNGNESICPLAPKKVSFKESDSMSDSQEDSTDEETESKEEEGSGVKDQIIEEFQLKINSLQRELEDKVASRKKSETKVKTLDMLANFGKRNRALELEKKQLLLQVAGLESTVRKMEKEGATKKDSKSGRNVIKLRDILKRVRSERDDRVNDNARLEQEVQKQNDYIIDLMNKENEFENELMVKNKALNDAENKVQILKKIRKSLEKENETLKMYLKQKNDATVPVTPNDVGENVSVEQEHISREGLHDVASMEVNVDYESDDGDKEKNLSEGEEDIIDSGKEEEGTSKEGSDDDDKEKIQSEEEEDITDEDIVDSSNDEPAAKEYSKAKSAKIHDMSDEVYLPSDEEYPEEQLKVGSTIISNYYNAKETIIDYSKVPAELFKGDTEFSASPCALNNSLIFIAVNNHVGLHKFEQAGRKKFCELAPKCTISWKKGSEITQVMILECESHPKVGRVVWACRHHARASIAGVKLQCQRYDYKTIEKDKIEETMSTVYDDTNKSTVKDDANKSTVEDDTNKSTVYEDTNKSHVDDDHVSSLEDISEDASTTNPKKRRSLSRRKKQKEATFEEAETFIEAFNSGTKK